MGWRIAGVAGLTVAGLLAADGLHAARAPVDVRDASLLTGIAPTHVKIGGAGGVQRYDGYKLARLPLTIGGTRAVLDSVFVFRDESKSPFEAYYGNLSGAVAAKFGGYTIDFRAMTFELGAKTR